MRGHFRRKRRVASGRLQGPPGKRPLSASSPASPSTSTRRELLSLAWPIAAAMLGETALGLVDTKIVGALGAKALGGVGFGTTLMYLFYALSFGMMRGVKVRTSHAVGQGKAQRGFAYARAGVLLGASYGLVIAFLMRDMGGFLRFLGADEALIPYAADFLRALSWGAPATCAQGALIQHRQATGDARTTMIVGLSSNLFNGVLAYLLVYGHLGLPGLGVAGAGYATALTQGLGLVVMGALFLRDERREKIRRGPGLGEAIREVSGLGLPTGLQFAAEVLAFTAFTAILGALGSEQIAASQIAMAVIRVSFLPGVAVAEATSVLVGRALGRKDLPEADRVTRAGLVTAMSFMAICGVLFALGGRELGRFFTSDEAVSSTVTRLLWVAAVFQILDAVNIVLRGALRGAKDVRLVALFGIAIVWISIPGSALVLGRWLGMGAFGAWLGFVAETALASVIFWLRWTRGGWRRAYTM